MVITMGWRPAEAPSFKGHRDGRLDGLTVSVDENRDCQNGTAPTEGPKRNPEQETEERAEVLHGGSILLP
jgi:hypothetical protein